MSAEMPLPRWAVAGAESVDFPWLQAYAVVAALNDVSATLASQIEARRVMVETIVDWEGSYRDEFDQAHERLTAHAAGMIETAASQASSLVDAAEDANSQQATLNDAAMDRAAERATRG